MDPIILYPIMFVVALIAGWIDSIAGGGGLITLPALLAAGLPPHVALGTNKLQSTFGSFTASFNHVRKGVVDLRRALWGIVFTAIGAAAGAAVVQLINSELLEKIIPILLLAILVYFIFSPRLGDHDSPPRMTANLFHLIFGLGLGFYDGVFGPGTGSFWAFAYVSLMGFNLLRASGYTKVMNFTSNILSLITFAIGGNVTLMIGVVMGAGQIIGAYFGSHMAIKRGARFIRPVFIIVVSATIVKLFIDYFK